MPLKVRWDWKKAVTSVVWPVLWGIIHETEAEWLTQEELAVRKLNRCYLPYSSLKWQGNWKKRRMRWRYLLASSLVGRGKWKNVKIRSVLDRSFCNQNNYPKPEKQQNKTKTWNSWEELYREWGRSDRRYSPCRTFNTDERGKKNLYFRCWPGLKNGPNTENW